MEGIPIMEVGILGAVILAAIFIFSIYFKDKGE